MQAPGSAGKPFKPNSNASLAKSTNDPGKSLTRPPLRALTSSDANAVEAAQMSPRRGLANGSAKGKIADPAAPSAPSQPRCDTDLAHKTGLRSMVGPTVKSPLRVSLKPVAYVKPLAVRINTGTAPSVPPVHTSALAEQSQTIVGESKTEVEKKAEGIQEAFAPQQQALTVGEDSEGTSSESDEFDPVDDLDSTLAAAVSSLLGPSRSASKAHKERGQTSATTLESTESADLTESRNFEYGRHEQLDANNLGHESNTPAESETSSVDLGAPVATDQSNANVGEVRSCLTSTQDAEPTCSDAGNLDDMSTSPTVVDGERFPAGQAAAPVEMSSREDVSSDDQAREEPFMQEHAQIPVVDCLKSVSVSSSRPSVSRLARLLRAQGVQALEEESSHCAPIDSSNESRFALRSAVLRPKQAHFTKINLLNLKPLSALKTRPGSHTRSSTFSDEENAQQTDNPIAPAQLTTTIGKGQIEPQEAQEQASDDEGFSFAPSCKLSLGHLPESAIKEANVPSSGKEDNELPALSKVTFTSHPKTPIDSPDYTEDAEKAISAGEIATQGAGSQSEPSIVTSNQPTVTRDPSLSTQPLWREALRAPFGATAAQKFLRSAYAYSAQSSRAAPMRQEEAHNAAPIESKNAAAFEASIGNAYARSQNQTSLSHRAQGVSEVSSTSPRTECSSVSCKSDTVDSLVSEHLRSMKMFISEALNKSTTLTTAPSSETPRSLPDDMVSKTFEVSPALCVSPLVAKCLRKSRGEYGCATPEAPTSTRPTTNAVEHASTCPREALVAEAASSTHQSRALTASPIYTTVSRSVDSSTESDVDNLDELIASLNADRDPQGAEVRPSPALDPQSQPRKTREYLAHALAQKAAQASQVTVCPPGTSTPKGPALTQPQINLFIRLLNERTQSKLSASQDTAEASMADEDDQFLYSLQVADSIFKD